MTNDPNNVTRPSGVAPVPVPLATQPSPKTSAPQPATLTSDLTGISYRRYKAATSSTMPGLLMVLGGVVAVAAVLALILSIIPLIISPGSDVDQEQVALLQTRLDIAEAALTTEAEAREAQDTNLMNTIAMFNDQLQQQNNSGSFEPPGSRGFNSELPEVQVPVDDLSDPTPTSSPTIPVSEQSEVHDNNNEQNSLTGTVASNFQMNVTSVMMLTLSIVPTATLTLTPQPTNTTPPTNTPEPTFTPLPEPTAVTVLVQIPIRDTAFAPLSGLTVPGKQVAVIGVISTKDLGSDCVDWLLIDASREPHDGLPNSALSNTQVIIGANSISPEVFANLPPVPADEMPATTPTCVRLAANQ